jgi:uncharacterized protein
MTGLELLCALVIAVGLVGIVVPVLPGSVLVLAAVLVWSWQTGGSTAWIVFAVVLVVLAIGTVVKYAVPGRSLKAAGIPGWTQLAGAVLGIVGFFVVPVVGLFLGFVLGVYLAELARIGHPAAWPSTKHALKAVGVSILIELAAALVATLVWVGGVVAT